MTDTKQFTLSKIDWREAGLPKESWTRIDRIVKVNEWNYEIQYKIYDSSFVSFYVYCRLR